MLVVVVVVFVPIGRVDGSAAVGGSEWYQYGVQVLPSPGIGSGRRHASSLATSGHLIHALVLEACVGKLR